MKINFNSLVIKIIFFGVMLVFLSLLIFSSIFLVRQRTELAQQILDKGRIFAEFSARAIYDDYISFYTQSSENNFLIFSRQLSNKLIENGDIIEVELIGINGRILFDSDELKTGRYNSEQARIINDPESLKLLQNEESSYRNINISGEQMTEIFIPIKEISSSHVLSMRYLLSYSSFNKAMLVIYRQIAVSFLIVFLLVFLFSIPFYSSTIRPITRLNHLAKKISQGNLDVKVDVGSNKDEIGILAENFNIMVDELRLAREKTVIYNKKLEEEIKAKTTTIEDLNKKNEELKKLNKFAIDW